MKRLSRTHSIFIFLVVIAMAQAVWWGHLLIRQQNLIANTLGTELAQHEAHRFQNMIWSEGLFFFAVWSFAVWTAFRTSREERLFDQAQKDFVGAITHELKTPLTNIRLCLDSVERHQNDPQKQKVYLERANRSVKRLENEIETVLVLAEANADLSMDHTQLLALVDQALVPAMDSQKLPIEVVKNIDPTIFLKTSSESVRMVLQMLLNNSAKYSAARAAEGISNFIPSIQVETRIEAGQLALSIQDNGIGMKPEESESIFRPFWRSEEVKRLSLPGTGVGLTLAKKFADRLKIGLSLRSDGPMQGTIATLTFRAQQFEKRSSS